MTTSIPTRPAAEAGNSLPMYVALIPWLLFTVIAEHGTLKIASIAALVIAIGIAIPGIRQGHPKVIEIGAAVAFAGFTIVAFAADPSVAHWLERYARAVAAGMLALIAVGSLLFTPFTEQYARERVPREFWNSPRFKAINRQLTLLWAGVFCAMVVSHVIAGEIDKRGANIFFNWVVPIFLVLSAVKRMEAITGQDDDNAVVERKVA
jgi:hypothetical protein